MEVIEINEQVHFDEPLVSAIGFFDGLHLGHMKLIDEVIRVSDELGYKKAVMTFDHHPLYILGHIKEEYYLTSIEDRKRILEEKGIDYLLVIHFTKDVAALSYQDFIDQYLIRLNIKHIVCGFDFHFGAYNQGDCHTLENYDSHLSVSIIDEVVYNQEKVSSTRIRDAIINGDMELVSVLLGRNYTIKGKVIKGRQIGHSIGFPTANIDYDAYLLPLRGVYAVKVWIDDKEYLGMGNIGYNPTVGALKKKSVEVNIFDFDKDIYDQTISISFLKMIRGETQFNSIAELKNQLIKDKKCIRNHF